MANLTPCQLREHLAYEVHYLVLSAVRFTGITTAEKTVYQDSSLLHARNLLEFTNPGQRTNNGWWIGNVGGLKPPDNDTTHTAWRKFINAKVSHLGEHG